MSRDLCAVADVIALVPGYALGDDSATDSLLGVLITEQSRDAMERTNREFTPIANGVTALNPRTFDIDQQVARLRRLQVGDLATLTAVTIKDQAGVTVQAMTLTSNVVSEPRIREDWQPIGTLWFRPDTSAPAPLRIGYVIEVDGTWGFPSVPTTVKQAVARLTLVRYLNDVAAQGTELAEAAIRADFNIAASIRWSLDALDRFWVPLFQSAGDWGSSPSRGVGGVDW